MVGSYTARIQGKITLTDRVWTTVTLLFYETKEKIVLFNLFYLSKGTHVRVKAEIKLCNKFLVELMGKNITSTANPIITKLKL